MQTTGTASTDDSALFVAPPEGLPTTIKCKVGGVDKEFPVSYWMKDVIQAGDYIHPQTGQRFSIDATRMDGWVETFNKMRGAGVDIHAPSHHTDRAEHNKGFVVKAERVGDKLRLLHQVFGDDGALMAARNLCSIKVEPDYVDEKGQHWGEAIVHSAFTPTPVITGMGSFIPASFAASRGQSIDDIPVFHLSASRSSIMNLSKLRTKLGAVADATDEQVESLALSRITTLETEGLELSRKATDATAKVIELSRGPTPPDPEALRDRAELTLGRIDLAMERGDLPPSIADKLKGWVNDANGKPKPFMLSRHDAFDERPIEAFLKLFEGAKLAPPTGRAVALARETPDAPPAPKEVTKERKAELIAYAH